MFFEDEIICVAFDTASGYTKQITYPKDQFGMNWILDQSEWGRVVGFDTYRTETAENGIDVFSEARSLSLKIEKRISGGVYSERYCITNHNIADYFFTKDTLGIHFPYNCIFENKTNLHDQSCVSHIWCGGDASWVYAAKPSGVKPYLVCNVTEGRIDDYSISYDVSRTTIGASYRGVIVVHPGDVILPPEKTLVLQFVFRFSDIAPDSGELNDYQRMRVSADRYSAFVGECIRCSFCSLDAWNTLEVTVNGEPIVYQQCGGGAEWTLPCQTPGERVVIVTIDGKQMRMKLNVLAPLSELLLNRARFITKKQQYHCDTSPLNGAYLIYDRDTDSLFYDHYFSDSNACRERIAMGVVVAQALQEHYDEEMMQSLRLHRTFVEREVFDPETATVYDGIHHNDIWKRAYNYPWMAVYYLEWYWLTKERNCLENAARIMISYYENVNGGRQESPCIRNHEICRALADEGMEDLRNTLLSYTLSHAERIIRDGSKCFSEEVRCTQFMFNGKINMLCQAYLLTGEERYLSCIPEFIEKSNAFCAKQPDFHVNQIAVRYWDLYWFGKSKIYGDSMPQWLSALTAETYAFMYEAGFGDAYKGAFKSVLMNNLCVYFPDGCASAGYLVPHKVTQYSSDPSYHNPCLLPGISMGHRYDSYANDQDWSMYYAVKLLSFGCCFKERKDLS